MTLEINGIKLDPIEFSDEEKTLGAWRAHVRSTYMDHRDFSIDKGVFYSADTIKKSRPAYYDAWFMRYRMGLEQ